MRIFLTGATGFVGSHLRRALVHGGYQVVGLARQPQTEEDGLRWVIGDVEDVDRLVDGMDGCQAVIHLVSIIREQGTATFQRVNVQGTKNVLSAMRQLRITRLLHMSALGAAPKTPLPYFRTKWAAEESVRGAGVDFTIFRPSLIFGPGDGFISLLASQLKRYPVTPVVGSGRYQFAPISIHAVTAAFVQAMQSTYSERAFELCGPETLTYLEILDILANQLKIRKPRVHLPPSFVALGAKMLTALGIPSPITPDQVQMLLLGNACAENSAQVFFDLPGITLAEGIREYLS